MTYLAESVESLEQLTVGWNSMVLDRDPAADVRDLPGIAVRWSDCQFAFWNALALTELGVPAELLEQRLGQAADIMRAKKHPGFLWVFDDLLDEDAREGLTAAAEQAGLQLAFPGTGMAGDILPVPDPVHPDLTFVRVTTDEQLQTYADLNSWAYGMPLRGRP